MTPKINEEKIVSHATSDIAKQLGFANEVRDFNKRLKRVKDNMGKASGELAVREFTELQKKHPDLIAVSGIVTLVYQLAMVDGIQMKKKAKGEILMFGLDKGAPKWARVDKLDRKK